MKTIRVVSNSGMVSEYDDAGYEYTGNFLIVTTKGTHIVFDLTDVEIVEFVR